MIREHLAAVKACLEAEPALAGKGYDTARTDSDGGLIRDTYFIVFGGGPDRLGDDRVTASQRTDSDAEFLYTVRSVSVTPDGCLAVASKVFEQLVGFAPVIEGRTCQKIRLDDADSQVTVNNNVRPPMFWMDADYLLISRRG